MAGVAQMMTETRSIEIHGLANHDLQDETSSVFCYHHHLLHTLIPEDISPESGTLPALRPNSECAEPKEGEGGFVSNVDEAEGSAADLDAIPVPSIVVPCIGGSERGCCGSADTVGN